MGGKVGFDMHVYCSDVVIRRQAGQCHPISSPAGMIEIQQILEIAVYGGYSRKNPREDRSGTSGCTGHPNTVCPARHLQHGVSAKPYRIYNQEDLPVGIHQLGLMWEKLIFSNNIIVQYRTGMIHSYGNRTHNETGRLTNRD